MTGKELWANYLHYTRDFTEHGRKLGFAGVALCWLFKRDDFTFPLVIYGALALFVTYFVCDMLQSLIAALLIRFFTERAERRLMETTGSIEGEIQKPRWLDWPAFLFFVVKGILLLGGFSIIGFYLLAKLGQSKNPAFI